MSPSARYVAWLVRRRVVVLVLAAVVAAVAGGQAAEADEVNTLLDGIAKAAVANQ